MKLLFGVLVAIVVPLIGWLAENYTTGRRGLVIGGLLAMAVITFAIVLVNGIAYHRIRQLEDA